MFSQYFGNYLLEKELLSPAELKYALNKKNSVHLKLGIMCVDFKYLTFEQVDRIHQLQTKTDKKFGELAVQEGYLTEVQLQKLLKMQKCEYLLISQVLIDEGYFTLNQINTILDNYRADLGLSKYEFEALKSNEIEKVVDVFVKLNGISDSRIYNDYFSLFVRNIVRFIDSGIRLDKAEEIKEYNYEWLVYQNMQGKINMFTGFASDEAGMAELGGRFAQKALNRMDEFAQSSVGEFINLQNGLFLSKLSEEGIEPDLHAQVLKRNNRLVASGAMFRIPFHLPFGKYDFIISEKLPYMWND